MADWDPFADPADDTSANALDGPSIRGGAAWVAAAGTEEVPPDPWNDTVYVDLVREAAKLAAEQEAAAREAAAKKRREAEVQAKAAADAASAERERRAAERRSREAKEAEVMAAEAKTASAAEEAGNATVVWQEEEDDPERAKLLEERKVHVRGVAKLAAMQAVKEAPAHAAASRKEAIKDYYAEEAAGNSPEAFALANAGAGEGGFREAAAKMMAESMGIKINFKPSRDPRQATGLLFPDQGSRSLRLLSGSRNLPAVRGMLESAAELLGFDLLEEQPVSSIHELFRGPEAIPPWLEETQLCQPAMYIAQLAAIEQLKARRPGCLDTCQAVAGLSLGEYAALTFAGVFTFESCLRIVALRGKAMQAAAEATPQRTLSVAGLSRDTVERLCRESGREPSEFCEITQHLFPDGFACAGSETAVERLLELARQTQGCKQVQLLKAAGSGGFHTFLMEPARKQLRSALKDIEASLAPPRVDVYMGSRKIAAGTDPAVIIERLSDQLTGPVFWEDAVRAMLKDGIGQFYECGPMQQLRGIMKRISEPAHRNMISVDHVQQNVKEKRGPQMLAPQDVTEGPLLPGGRNRVRIVW